MSQSDVGPNDIVIHLVNPYRCGDCGSEFCLRSLFLEHLAEHIDMLKTATPCHQIVSVCSLVEQQPGGITVTRDILQINEQQMFELQDASMDYTQLTPLKTLEQAGILSLPRPLQIQRPVPPKSLPKENPIVLDVRDIRGDVQKFSLLKNQQIQQNSPGFHAQILSTNSSSHHKISESSQINIDSDPCISELDTIVQQALYGDGKIKEECTLNIDSSLQLEAAQPPTEVTDNRNADFEGFGQKSIFGNGKIFSSTKGKGKGVVCSICSNIFANTSVLERHQVVHTGAKPYSCNICFKEFNDISSHRKHTLIHKRQHRCPVCHRMYLRRTHLLLHMKQHKKKRFIQFGNHFHEVQVSVTRNAEGQLVQEYNLPILSALGHEKSVDVSKGDDQLLVKDEFCEASNETNVNITEAQTGGTDMSQVDEQLEAEQKKKIIYRCGHCKMLIFTRPTLSRHLIKHTNTRPFQCEKCLKSFHDKADLLHHHKTHTKPVQCKTCLSSFSKILYLQNHLLKGCPVTDNDSRFTLLPDLRCQCNICQKILKNKANVLRHLRVHAFQERNRTSFQAGETTFATPTENLQSSEPKNLSQNVENHFQPLPNSVGFHCMICGQEFRFKSFIITHVRMHLNQRPYKCPECSKCFFARQMLKKHQQNHTRPYKCPTCNKSFIRRYLMKDHFKKRHETEDPLKDITELLDEKLIQCDICGKTMKSFQKSVMLSHIRLHKDVRPFRCKVCQKSFISDNALRKHSLNHTRPYKCHICNKGFSRRYLLTDHFKKKCSRKKKENSIVQVSSEDAPVAQITETVEDLPASTVDASTECRPYEAKVITEQDPTTGSATYICVPCDKRFTIYDVMLRHINTFSKPTACKYCKQVFEDKHLSISHQRSCLGPSSHPPQTCSKKNKALGEQQEKIQKIMKDISQKIETLTSESSFSEITAKNLVDESLSDCVLDTVSEQVAPAKDVSGDSDVKSMRTTLERTLKVLKKGQDSLSCPECGRSFNTPRGLKIHASSHVRLFKCEVCDKDFMQISSLRAHAKIHKNSEETGTESEVDVPTRPQRKRGQQHTEVLMSEHQNWGENDVRKGLKQSQMSTKIVSGKRRSRKVSDEGKVSDDDRVAEINLDHKDLEQVTHRLMQSGTRGRPYSCKMCRRRFTEQSGLSGHMLQNHGLRS